MDRSTNPLWAYDLDLTVEQVKGFHPVKLARMVRDERAQRRGQNHNTATPEQEAHAEALASAISDYLACGRWPS